MKGRIMDKLKELESYVMAKIHFYENYLEDDLDEYARAMMVSAFWEVMNLIEKLEAEND
jgi:hypothetical protein